MSSQPSPEADISQELQELGELFKRAVQVARAHPHVKEFETKITHAVNDLSTQIGSATQGAREPLKKAGAQVKQAAQTYKESGASEDIARGIAKSVRLLNEQVRKAIEEMEKGSKT